MPGRQPAAGLAAIPPLPLKRTPEHMNEYRARRAAAAMYSAAD